MNLYLCRAMMTWLMQDILQPIQIQFSPTLVWVLETEYNDKCFCLIDALWIKLYLPLYHDENHYLVFLQSTQKEIYWIMLALSTFIQLRQAIWDFLCHFPKFSTFFLKCLRNVITWESHIRVFWTLLYSFTEIILNCSHLLNIFILNEKKYNNNCLRY